MRRGTRSTSATPAGRAHGRLAVVLALLLAAGAARQACADVTPGARPVLDRLLAATGGAAARDSERTLHLKGRIHSAGLDGRWELWCGAPDRWVRQIKLGSLRIREGFDGIIAWRSDLTGHVVHRLAASEADDAREEGWFLNERWALSDQGGGTIRLGSHGYRGGTSYDVLEVTAPVGEPRRLFVNGTTGFIDRMQYTRDQDRIEEQPRDYRKLGGRMRASVLQSPTFLPTDKPVERMTVDSVWVNVPLDSAFFAPPEPAGRRITWKGKDDIARAPFAYGAKAVQVKVSINGAAPVDFILDTGASMSVVDIDLARDMKLPLEGGAAVEGIAASAAMQFARVRSIGLHGAGAAATLRDFRVAVVDLGKADKYVLWRDMHGLLGADFLSRFVVTIDYDSLRVTLRDPARFTPGAGAPIPFELYQGIPVVDLTVDGRCTGKFLVDVGNSFHFTVHGSMVRSCGLLGRKHRRDIEVMGGGIGGGFVATLCRLDSVRIGPYAWSEPVATLALGTRGGIGSQDYAGNIGNDFLERFRCTFDYARQVLWLEPGRRYGQRDRVSRLGLLLVRLEHHVFAGNVVSRSAAYEAGLRWYDEILSIDGKPALDWTRDEVDRLLEEGDVGSVHTITYRRHEDDPPQTVSVTLKDVL